MRTEKEHSALLYDLMAEYAREDIILAFSGGVDSGLLLYMACEATKKTGHKVYAVTVKTTLHPCGEVEQAAAMAKTAGAEHIVVEVDELENAGVMDNPKDRCYRCKKYIFTRLRELAAQKNITNVLDGTNEDDLHVYRPGIRALKELGIKSPLASCQMTKQEVRALAASYGLFVAAKPSAPCLATRFPYGTALSYEKMQQVDQAEGYIRSLGYYNVRVRVHGDIARIEVDDKDLEKIIVQRKEILARMRELGYLYVALDLAGFRSGSMDLQI